MFVKASSVNSREYIQAQLSSPLVAGQSYCFSMLVRAKAPGPPSPTVYASDGIGAWFNNVGIVDINTMNGGSAYIERIQ